MAVEAGEHVLRGPAERTALAGFRPEAPTLRAHVLELFALLLPRSPLFATLHNLPALRSRLALSLFIDCSIEKLLLRTTEYSLDSSEGMANMPFVNLGKRFQRLRWTLQSVSILPARAAFNV